MRRFCLLRRTIVFMKAPIILLALLSLAALLAAAGCITTQQPQHPSTPADIPIDMQYALDDISADLSHLEYVVIENLTILANELQTAENTSDIQDILSACYAEHPCLTAIIYRDTIHDEYISVPVYLSLDLSKYSVNITEQDFQNAGGVIVRNNIFSAYHGYLNIYYKPVYDQDNTYCGYVVFVIDVYSMIYLHPELISAERTYDGYICTFTDNDDKILYSSIQEITGNIVTESGYFDGLVWLPRVGTGDSACTYTAASGFYLYEGVQPTEMITAWHTLYSTHGQKYTLYLTRPVNQTEMKTEIVYSSNPLQALNDTNGAYLYAQQNGKSAIMLRIIDGYYQTPMMLIDMNGNILASANSLYQGKNLLNVRGMYGISYIESAVMAAEQGSGYIYYLTAAERTAKPRSAEYTLGIVMPVGNYFIFSKIAGDSDAVLLDANLRPDMTRVSHNILKIADTEGIETAAALVNANGKAAPGVFAENLKTDIADIAILDVDGNVYASIQHPELVGKSATFMTDVYGGSLTRRAIMLAKTGSGYMSQLTANPEKEGYVDLWNVIVEPVDENYYIYTSVLVETFKDVLTPCLDKMEPTK